MLPVCGDPEGHGRDLLRARLREIPFDSSGAKECGCESKAEVGLATGRMSDGRTQVAADHLGWQHDRGVSLDSLPLDRIVGIAGPHTVGELQNSEIGAPAARGA